MDERKDGDRLEISTQSNQAGCQERQTEVFSFCSKMPKLALFVIHIIVIRSTAVFQVKPIITLHKCDILLEVI